MTDTQTGAPPPDRCTWFHDHGVDRLVAGDPIEGHLDTCADCSKLHDDIRRLRARMSALGPTLHGRSDWQARVWAEVARRRAARQRRRWLWPALAAATVMAAIAVVWLARAPGPGPAPRATLALSWEVRPGSGAPAMRSHTAQPGDVVVLQADVGGARHVELWLYHQERTLIGRHPAGVPRGGRIFAEQTLRRRGRHQIIVLSSDEPIVEPTGDFEQDMIAVRASSAHHELIEIDVL